MIVLPAIDLLRGACVRLYRGDFDRSREFSRDPAATARRFVREGARALHVVDLDGAREGRPRNAEHVASVLEACDVPVQVGGGLRRTEDVERYLSAGIDRVIVGTASAESPEWLAALIERFGAERVAAGVDVKGGEVMVRGWLEGSGRDVEEILGLLEEVGAGTIVYTNVTRDGTLSGPDVEGARRVADRGFRTFAAGGISRAEHLRALRDAGVAGAVVGSALYEGRLSLPEARRAAGEPPGDDGRGPGAAGSEETEGRSPGAEERC